MFEQDATKHSPIWPNHCFCLGDANLKDLRDVARLHCGCGTHSTPVLVAPLSPFGSLCIPFFPCFILHFYNVESLNLKIITNGHWMIQSSVSCLCILQCVNYVTIMSHPLHLLDTTVDNSGTAIGHMVTSTRSLWKSHWGFITRMTFSHSGRAGAEGWSCNEAKWRRDTSEARSSPYLTSDVALCS